MIPVFLIRYVYLPLYRLFNMKHELDLSSIHIDKRNDYYIFSRHDTELSISDAFKILEVLEKNKKDKGGFLTRKRKKNALEVKYQGKSYFVKEHSYKGIPDIIKNSLRLSFSTKNLFAIAILEKSGVQTLRVEYAIEERRRVLPKRSFLIARFIKDSQPLDEYVYNILPKKRRKDFFKDLARIVAHLHENSFFHGDMGGDNTLIIEKKGGWDIYLVDLDSVKYKNLKIKDRVEELARLNCTFLDMREVSIRDRLYFLREYIINSESLNLNNVSFKKKFIKAIINRSLKMAEKPGRRFLW